MNPLIIIFGIMAAGLVLLIVNHDGGQTFGISNEDFGDIIYLLPIATLLGAGILASRERLGQNLRYLAIWVLIALVLVAAYLYRNDARDLGLRMAAEFLPGTPVVLTADDGRREVVIRKRNNGHFQLTANIGGQEISMLVDTGASTIALSFEDARRIGLDPENLAFNQTILTANGTAQAARTIIQEIAVGPIVRRNVSASVVAPGMLRESLLGMNFLSSLTAISMGPDEMRLAD